jgi:ribosome biogenesis GTPase
MMELFGDAIALPNNTHILRRIFVLEKNNEMNIVNESETLNKGRVVAEYKGIYKIMFENEMYLCECAGKFRFSATKREDFPAVGDWVIWREAGNNRGQVVQVLPRTSKFSRMMAGVESGEQIIATNIDYLGIVSSMNEEFNSRRLERYLLMAWESGASPLIILSKADLCLNPEFFIEQAEIIAMGIPVIVLSSIMHEGIEKIQTFLVKEKTIAFVGSSGVGKSTLINTLINENIQIVKEIREDDAKGKHTTTHRELFALQNGSFVIDTPGMREMQLWQGESGLTTQFSDIESLMAECKFRNCHHNDEPGCAIREALSGNTLSVERFQSYLKLQKELEYSNRKASKHLQSLEKQKWKKRTIQNRNRS